MADSAWFEIDGDPTRYLNAESVRSAAQTAAKDADDPVEIYRCTRTLVRTVHRSVTITEVDVPS